MNKHHKELDVLFNQLSIDNNKLNKTLSLVTLSTKTVSDSVYNRILSKLSSVLVDTHQCLNYLLANLDTLDKQTLNIAKNYINTLLDQVNKHINLLDQLNPNPKLFFEEIRLLHNNMVVLNEMFLEIDKSIYVRILDDEEKLLSKNLRGQLQYINKLMNNPENFTPENVKNTTKKAKNILIVLKSLETNVYSRDDSNSSYFIELFSEAMNKTHQLHQNLANLEKHNNQNINRTTQPQMTKTLDERIKDTVKKGEAALRTLESKAKMLNRVLNSSNQYIYLKEKTENPLEVEKINHLSSKLSQILNKLTHELIHFDFKDITSDFHEILDDCLQDINRENIQEVNKVFLLIQNAVDTMIENDKTYLENVNQIEQLADPSIDECIRRNMNSAYQSMYDKLESLYNKIQDVEKIFDIETKITVAIAESKNILNDIWRQKSTLSQSQKQTMIDQNINQLTQVLSELIENKSAFMSTAEGREHLSRLLSKIDTSIDELIRAIPDKKLQKDYQKAYDILAKNRLQTKQSLPNWASIKPTMSGPSKQSTPPSSDSEKMP